MRRPSIGLALPLALVLFLTGCVTGPVSTVSPTVAPAVSTTPAPVLDSGVLRLWMTPLDRIDPIRSTNEGFLALSSLLYDSLFILDENDEPIPHLCGSFFVNQDFTDWTFPMDSGLFFNDGTALLPVDVAASANLWLQKGTGTAHDALTALSPQFLVAGTTSLVVRLDVPEPDLPRLLCFPVIPSAYAIEQDPAPLIPVPGTGPFQIVSYEPGTGLRLERNVPVAGHVQSIFVYEYKEQATALERFQSDRLDALPLDETSYRTLRMRKNLRISRYDSESMVVPVFGTAKGRALSDADRRAAIARILSSLFESDEFLSDFRVFPSSRGLSTGLASLVYGRPAASETPSVAADPSPSVAATATPTATGGIAPTGVPLTWSGTLDVVAVSGSFEAEIGASIVARLVLLGIPARLRAMTPANCMAAFANGWYDIAIQSRTMPAVPGEPATAVFSNRSGTPFPDPLIRSRGVLLGPRVFGELVPCADDIYRGIEDAWVWSGS